MLTNPDAKTVQYTYDALNRLSKATDSTGKATTYSYDGASNLLGFTHPNGAVSTYEYDAANRLLSITNLSAGKLLSSFAYIIDKLGNRVQMTSNGSSVNRYSYDNLYRLTSWTAPSGQVTQWAYDPVGNRTSMISSAGMTSYTYDAADELLTSAGMSFTYDGNGNQLTKATGSTTTSYTWDALNRLLSVVGGSANTHYEYDGDGNRIAQQVPAGKYAYVDDVASALPSVVNENGPDGAINYIYGLSTISASSSAFEYFYQFDGLGSAINITDPTGAQKVDYSYDPWGKMTLPLDPLGTKEKYKFTGEASDPNNGLVYLRARYYDSAIGRFISRDVVRKYTSAYIYAQNLPTSLVDPSGWTSLWAQLDMTARLFRHILATW